MDTDGAEAVTFTLHRLTSNTAAGPWYEHIEDPRLLQDFTSNDPGRRTALTKQYDSALPRIPLPRELPTTTTPALAVLAGTAAPEAAPLNLATLSRLLHLSAGVVRTAQIGERTHLFRAAGSAGGRFPLELYVAVPHHPTSGPAGKVSLPPGVHWYDPVEHALVTVAPAPTLEQRGPTPPAPTIIVTGIPWRTGWRYRERGFRHVYWDAGTMLSQLLALADSAGLAPRLYTRFPDQDVSTLIGADRVHEWPVALVTLGEGTPIVASTARTTATGMVDAHPLEFPLVTAAQRAGDAGALGQPWDFSPCVEVSGEPVLSLDAVITRRGSQRRMDASCGLPLETLRTCMKLALRGISIEHFVAVHNVTGLAPGIYRCPDLDNPIRTASEVEIRDELRHACLDQMLGHDAAFVVISTTEASRLSGREYREAQLAAGIAEGRLHLAAYALDASATGMTFHDHAVPALLDGRAQPTPDRPRHGLLFTCVGVPANSTKPAGPPGAPAPVRIVAPRASKSS